MSRVSNNDLMGVLLELKGDVGGLKATTEMQLEGLKNHGARLSALEAGASKQKGAAKVWTLVGTGVGALVSGGITLAAAWLKVGHR